MLPTILLSAGHNPGAEGANHEGLSEHKIMGGICFYLAGQLADEGTPVVVVPSLQLVNKIAWVNEYAKRTGKVCVAVELHANSSDTATPRGISVFHHKGNLNAVEMGKCVLAACLRPSWPSRGLKNQSQSNLGSLGWISKTTMPALLIEVGFITNPKERVFMENTAGQQSLAIRLADGLSNAMLYLDAKLSGEGQTKDGRWVGKPTYSKDEWRGDEPKNT